MLKYQLVLINVENVWKYRKIKVKNFKFLFVKLVNKNISNSTSSLTLI